MFNAIWFIKPTSQLLCYWPHLMFLPQWWDWHGRLCMSDLSKQTGSHLGPWFLLPSFFFVLWSFGGAVMILAYRSNTVSAGICVSSAAILALQPAQQPFWHLDSMTWHARETLSAATWEPVELPVTAQQKSTVNVNLNAYKVCLKLRKENVKRKRIYRPCVK